MIWKFISKNNDDSQKQKVILNPIKSCLLNQDEDWKGRKPPKSQPILRFGIIAVLGIINIAMMMYFKEVITQKSDIHETKAFAKVSSEKKRALESGFANPKVNTIRIKGVISRKKLLYHHLRENGVPSKNIKKLTREIKDVLDLRFAKIGDTFTAIIEKDTGKVAELQYVEKRKKRYQIDFNGKKYMAFIKTIPEIIHIKSLLLSYNKDFNKNLKKQKNIKKLARLINSTFPGIDLKSMKGQKTLKVLYEEKSIEGQFTGLGNILAVSVKGKNEQDLFEAVYSEGSYFSRSGLQIGKIPSKFPIKGIEGKSRIEDSSLERSYFLPDGHRVYSQVSGVLKSIKKTKTRGYSITIHMGGDLSFKQSFKGIITSKLKPGMEIKKGHYFGVCYRFKKPRPVQLWASLIRAGEPVSPKKWDKMLRRQKEFVLEETRLAGILDAYFKKSKEQKASALALEEN